MSLGEETISLSKTMVSRKKFMDPWSSLQKPLVDGTSRAPCTLWAQPLSPARSPPEAWDWVPLPQLPASCKPMYFSQPQANLLTCITIPSTRHGENLGTVLQIYYFASLFTFYTTYVMPGLGGTGKQTLSVPLNNSHLLNASYGPATVGGARET